MDLAAQARELVRNLNNRLSASAYDVSWLARLPAENGDPRWPDLIDWLVAHQWPDGSWGGTIPYYHDRILCTLAAMIALQEKAGGKDAAEAVRRGERYVWHNYPFLHHDPMELVGFELILPTLLEQARTLDLDVPRHSCGYGRIRDAKLALMPMELLYKPGTSAAFSIEFLGSSGDPTRLYQFQGANGASANSPATTAYTVIQSGNHNSKALHYLEQVKGLPSGVPAFYPFRTFEIVWVLEHLAFGGFTLHDLVDAEVWNSLRSALGRTGTGIDPLFGINDGDTTAVTLHVLARGKQPVDPSILHHFEEPGTHTFRTFDFERNASVVTNIHALEALMWMPEYPNLEQVWEGVLSMLLEHQLYQTYWIDKWHASPYYATAHILIVLMNVGEYEMVRYSHAIDWLVHTQRSDGSWGYFDRGTVEETAYALMALLHYQRHTHTLCADVLHKGMAYLMSAVASDVAFPELWIAKTLYTPKDIVKAAILATQLLYEQTFGRLPD